MRCWCNDKITGSTLRTLLAVDFERRPADRLGDLLGLHVLFKRVARAEEDFVGV